MFLEIITSKIVICSFLGAAISQIIKFFINWFKTGQRDWYWLLRDAGMPSAHTATVTALTVSLMILEGITHLTLTAGVLSAIVIRNVIGDKIFAEKQENLINLIIDKIQQSLAGERVVWSHLIGHTIREVFAGFIVGLIVTIFIFYII